MPISLAEAAFSLKAFLASRASFSIVRSVAGERLKHAYGSLDPAQHATKTLYILDSSFNPPQVAHQALAISALSKASELSAGSYRLLLLFSTHNADKDPGVAAFEQRLAMMVAFAEDMCDSTVADTIVDVGLTDKPYYNDKTTVIEQSKTYPSAPRHVHLIGFDSLTRIFTPKYYPSHNPPLSALEGFFQKHGLHVMLRPDDNASESQQRKFLEDIRSGELDTQGAQRDWTDQIDIVPADTRSIGVSSTRVREAIQRADWPEVKTLCTEGVTKWIRNTDPYRAAEDNSG